MKGMMEQSKWGRATCELTSGEYAHAEFVTITPEIAKSWIELTAYVGRLGLPEFRDLNLKKVEHYADKMRKGEWYLRNYSIGLLKNGAVADGQHRLNAIIQSGVTVTMLVVKNLDKDVRVKE